MAGGMAMSQLLSCPNSNGEVEGGGCWQVRMLVCMRVSGDCMLAALGEGAGGNKAML